MSSPRTTSELVFDEVRDLVFSSDGWVLSVADDLVRIGGWARREAEVVTDSARAAYATTRKVAARMRLGRGAAPAASSRPGSRLIYMALGRVVERHAATGYASLADDTRFWMLVHVLRRHCRPARDDRGGWTG